ncbi:MAG: hypothetical protein HFI73_03560 [Bacilli bacterium]|jgi:hypothetical protein|nr:hypothetical protein [Bacilli bacterium]
MKIIKYSFMMLGVAIIANIALVQALTNLNQFGLIYGTATIPAGKTVQLNNDVQKTELGVQSVTNTRTFTPLTDPCPKCNIEVNLLRKLSSGKYDKVGTVFVKQGQTDYFLSQSVSQSFGEFNLSFRRVDATALTTYVGFDWRVQDSK